MINKNDILELLIFTQENDTFNNINDIRSITINGIFKQIENLNIAVTLSEKINDLEYLKSNISESIQSESINDIFYNYEGFIKDAFFMKCFILVENHINQIAEFYEKSKNDIKHYSSVNTTFKNLTNSDKSSLFSSLTQYDIDLFDFYCYLRNTNHRIGFQTKTYKSINIFDESSVINKSQIKLELIEGKGNTIDTQSLFLLQEQIIKLIIKVNSKIPTEDYIEHILAKTYN